MKNKMVITQVKREFWENKVSFVNAPIIISTLILVATIVAAFYSDRIASGDGHSFSFTTSYTSSDDGHVSTQSTQQISNSGSVDQVEKKFNIIASMASDPKAFNDMILGVVVVNCILLHLVFLIVLCAYSLRCLFDDRKNKDILFWRSMPVSETTNVLIKLSMVLIIAPIVILALNFILSVAVFFMGLIFLGLHGVSLSYLIASVINGGAFYSPFKIFYELIFSLLMLMPIIGFAFFSSAFARKTPFFTFISPIVLIIVDRILNTAFGINIKVFDWLALYGRALTDFKSAFVLQENFEFQQFMILPFATCIGLGALFVAGAIWLRNHRYEI